MHRLPFVHGYADQLADKGFLDNPYPQDSNDFRVWIDGYVVSMQDHPPRMNVFAGHLGSTPDFIPQCPCYVCRNHAQRLVQGCFVHWHYGRWIPGAGKDCPRHPRCTWTKLP